MAGFRLATMLPAIPPAFVELVDIYQRFLDLFLEHGRRRERIGDMVVGMGPRRIQELMGLPLLAVS
jgi:hypothetical protein